MSEPEKQKPARKCPGCSGEGYIWVVGKDGETTEQQTCSRCYGTGIA